jgi:DNA-binding response OmpR family regulator
MKQVLLVTPSLELTGKDEEFFSQNSIELKQAKSGTEARELLSSSDFDIVVAELALDGVSGDELCASIKESDNDTYVILACSGKKNELKTCGRCGANAHIPTPLDTENLLHRISTILKVPTKRATRVLVKVKINSTIKSEPFFSISHNVSTSGMMLEAEQSLALGDIIACSFYLPESERLMAPCKVVRIDKSTGANNRYGVEFVDLDDENKSVIENFVRQEREAGNFY